jgi:hypothetical protein
MNTPKVVNNNEIYNKYLTDYPPQYNIGDKVDTKHGIAKICGRVFKEREKVWRYSVKYDSINFIMDLE